jgi:hypothetical protein
MNAKKDDSKKWWEHIIVKIFGMLIACGAIGGGTGMFAGNSKTEADINKAVQYQIQEYTLKREVDNARLQQKVADMETYWNRKVDEMAKEIHEIKMALK